MRLLKAVVSTSIFSVALGAAGIASASSHREAPAIAQDQYADNTDTYVFISPADPNNVVFVANYVPLLLPPTGPNFYSFADSVLYEIRIDNNGDAVPDISYEYRFRSQVVNGMTFLYNTGAIDSLTDDNLNVRQTYTLQRRDLATGVATMVAADVPVAPWYVGNRSFPDPDGAGAMTSDDAYEAVARMAIRSAGGVRSFAGPRDEPFFVDLYVFDALGVGGAAPVTNGVNVMSLVLEVPITDVAAGGVRPPAGDTSVNGVIGVYAIASRRQVQILRRGRGPDRLGQWVQVSRLAWPLVNEVVIPLQDKDRFNRTNPVDDVSNFGAYVLTPELTGLLAAILGLPCVEPSAVGPALVGLLSPNGTTPADLLRINIAAGETNANSHFPNGRALADDVVDTELSAFCFLLAMPLGDGVNGNDRNFSTTFPYLATPFSGHP